MTYKVIQYFTDLQDFGHPYHEGDIFPRDGLKVSEKRLMELSTANNRRKTPLIKAVDDKDFVVNDKVVGRVKDDVIEITDEETIKENTYTKTEINRMPVAELKDLAILNGIKVDEDTTGSQLKKLLIEKFEL